MPGGIARIKGLQQALAGCAASLRYHLHPTVIQVFGVSAQPQRLGGPGTPPSEPHTLNLALNVGGKLSLGGLFRGFVGEEIEESHGNLLRLL